MDYQTLQDRLREELPGACIGFLDGTPYVVSAINEIPELRSQTNIIDPDYSGGFAYIPGGSSIFQLGLKFLDKMEKDDVHSTKILEDQAA